MSTDAIVLLRDDHKATLTFPPVRGGRSGRHQGREGHGWPSRSSSP